jgi:hypothetical protein
MPTFTAYGTYAGRSGRMLSFCFLELESPDITAASELVRHKISSRSGYAGKLSFSVFDASPTPMIDGAIPLEDICILPMT